MGRRTAKVLRNAGGCCDLWNPTITSRAGALQFLRLVQSSRNRFQRFERHCEWLQISRSDLTHAFIICVSAHGNKSMACEILCNHQREHEQNPENGSVASFKICPTAPASVHDARPMIASPANRAEASRMFRSKRNEERLSRSRSSIQLPSSKRIRAVSVRIHEQFAQQC